MVEVTRVVGAATLVVVGLAGAAEVAAGLVAEGAAVVGAAAWVVVGLAAADVAAGLVDAGAAGALPAAMTLGPGIGYEVAPL